jgi:hypothetical protein
MPQSPDDLSKFVVKTNVSADTFQNAARSLAGCDGAIFDPMEAVAAGIRSGNAIAQMLKACALLFARGIIAPVEVVLRRNFGERYFNGLVAIMVLLILLTFRYVMDFNWFYCVLLGVVFFGVTTYNQWVCFFRDRAGDYWHSYSEGDSRLRIQKWDEFFAKWNFTFDPSTLFVEPLAVIGAGIVCLLLPSQWIMGAFRMNPLALYLLIAGVVLFFYQLYCYCYRRNLLLDEKDNGVIAEIREKLAHPSEKVGTFVHKGVTYAILGGKNEWNLPPVPKT